jgi:hypothetical protein
MTEPMSEVNDGWLEMRLGRRPEKPRRQLVTGRTGGWRQSRDSGQQGAAPAARGRAATAARDAAATVARGAAATAAYKGPRRRRLEVGAATAAGGLTAVDQGGRD